MLTIGPLTLQNHLIMAPMAGITNSPFRQIVKRLGAGLVVTEMISAVGLSRGDQKTLRYLKASPEEKPLSVQLFGADAQIMATAAEIAIQNGADIIDINMGCPARKVLKNGCGGALLQNPEAVRKIVTAVRGVCTVPLTVKMRSGWAKTEANCMEIAQIVEECGADAVTLHPRFVKQGFSGSADWPMIKSVKDRVRIPVIGNGDVTRPQMALQMREQTGCDGVMIGRGARSNPWIFEQISALEERRKIPSPGLRERRTIILEHFRLLSSMTGEETASKMMRGHLLWYTRGLPYSSRFRGAFTGIRNFESMIEALDQYFDAVSRSSDP